MFNIDKELILLSQYKNVKIPETLFESYKSTKNRKINMIKYLFETIFMHMIIS